MGWFFQTSAGSLYSMGLRVLVHFLLYDFLVRVLFTWYGVWHLVTNLLYFLLLADWEGCKTAMRYCRISMSIQSTVMPRFLEIFLKMHEF